LLIRGRLFWYNNSNGGVGFDWNVDPSKEREKELDSCVVITILLPQVYQDCQAFWISKYVSW